jgi:hypothetical protein
MESFPPDFNIDTIYRKMRQKIGSDASRLRKHVYDSLMKSSSTSFPIYVDIANDIHPTSIHVVLKELENRFPVEFKGGPTTSTANSYFVFTSQHDSLPKCQ